uniref:BMERB domain-containing protein n=1 Tax=Neogobius melanostomus TaxID=47308 RepID=A0A8C6T8Q0_9GOBI
GRERRRRERRRKGGREKEKGREREEKEREKKRGREREKEIVREREEKEREKEREREREKEKGREREKEIVREREEKEREKKREKERVREREEKERVREREEKEREKERVREREEKEKERVREREEKEREKERVREREEKEREKERVREREENEKAQSQAKASAAAFISKKLTEENNKPGWTVNQTHNPAEVAKKEVVRGRVRLRADASLLSDLTVPTSEDRRSPSPRCTPEAQKSRSTSPHPSGAQSESPSDWRARLKPVAKDPSPKSSSQPPSKPWTNGSDPSQSTVPSRLAPRIPVTAPAHEGVGTPPRDSRGDKDSNKTKPKAEHIPQDEILRELQQIEDNLNELERTGVDLELKLRTSEENGEDESVMNDLMVDWFTLIRNKQVAMRRESELVYIGRTQELEVEQPTVEQELRSLLDKPEHLKTPWDRRREEKLMKKLVEIVNNRNALVEGLDEDRLREEEEDEQLNQLMMNFNLKKDKSKKKSPMSRLFGWSSKAS